MGRTVLYAVIGFVVMIAGIAIAHRLNPGRPLGRPRDADVGCEQLGLGWRTTAMVIGVVPSSAPRGSAAVAVVTTPVAPAVEPTPQETRDPAAAYVGLTKQAARGEADRDDRPWRIGREDDEQFHSPRTSSRTASPSRSTTGR